jgi:hypothetical protein
MKQAEILNLVASGEHSGHEEQMRLFQEGGFLHVETLPVSGATFTHLDLRRIHDYFSRRVGLNGWSSRAWTRSMTPEIA